MSSPSTAADPPPTSSEPTPLQVRGMRAAILTQCAGCLGYLTFVNGLMLVYLTNLGQPSARVVFYLSLPTLISAFIMLPTAYISDRHGKKLLGLIGAIVISVGFVMLTTAGWFPPGWRQIIILLAMLLYGLGAAAFNAPWFALLSPVVPEELRARFFGKLRMSWQIVGVVFSAGCALILLRDVSITTYMAALALATVGTILRAVFFWGIPELERAQPSERGMIASCQFVLQAPGYMPFCAYVFMLTLSTSSCPVLFGLIQKHVMQLSDSTVVWLGLGMMVGQLAGFYLGGKAVDRWGTKSAFMVCHLCFGLALLLIAGRGFLPLGLQLAAVALLQVTFGVVGAASNIAVSTEMLALIPPQDKSISTSLCTLLQGLGASVSGLVFSATLKLEMLAERWTLLGVEFSRYDTLLLGCAMSVILLVVTLGLVPSVMGKSQWMPRGV